MKKKNFRNLALNKVPISQLNGSPIKGGLASGLQVTCAICIVSIKVCIDTKPDHPDSGDACTYDCTGIGSGCVACG